MVTIQEISKRAGVTPATVSNILNNRFKAQRSDAALRAMRVKQIAAEMGYRVNLAAKATRTGRTGCIGMLSSHRAAYSVHFPDFDLGLGEALEERNLLLVTGLINDQLIKDQSFVPRIVAESLVDGLLINYVYQIPPEIKRMISEHNRPAIWINSKHAADCVYPDDYGAAVAAVKYLVARGHRRIAYGSTGKMPSPEHGHYCVVDRLNGYLQGIRTAGLEARVWEPTEFIGEDRYQGHGLRHAHELLSHIGNATALIHGTSPEPLLLALAQRGVRLPQDLSLVNFVNDSGKSVTIDCTRLVVPFSALGRQAVRVLCEKIDGANAPIPPVAVRFEVTEGSTVQTVK